MSAPSLHVPLAVEAKTPQDLMKKMLAIQGAEGGKVATVAIYYDSGRKLHIWWYYPLKNLGGMSL